MTGTPRAHASRIFIRTPEPERSGTTKIELGANASRLSAGAGCQAVPDGGAPPGRRPKRWSLAEGKRPKSDGQISRKNQRAPSTFAHHPGLPKSTRAGEPCRAPSAGGSTRGNGAGMACTTGSSPASSWSLDASRVVSAITLAHRRISRRSHSARLFASRFSRSPPQRADWERDRHRSLSTFWERRMTGIPFSKAPEHAGRDCSCSAKTRSAPSAARRRTSRSSRGDSWRATEIGIPSARARTPARAQERRASRTVARRMPAGGPSEAVAFPGQATTISCPRDARASTVSFNTRRPPSDGGHGDLVATQTIFTAGNQCTLRDPR